jgi:hypothetical protein
LFFPFLPFLLNCFFGFTFLTFFLHRIFFCTGFFFALQKKKRWVGAKPLTLAKKNPLSAWQPAVKQAGRLAKKGQKN